jgi:hypothetical protein
MPAGAGNPGSATSAALGAEGPPDSVDGRLTRRGQRGQER